MAEINRPTYGKNNTAYDEIWECPAPPSNAEPYRVTLEWWSAGTQGEPVPKRFIVETEPAFEDAERGGD
jgi:hypothetical protein